MHSLTNSGPSGPHQRFRKIYSGQGKCSNPVPIKITKLIFSQIYSAIVLKESS